MTPIQICTNNRWNNSDIFLTIKSDPRKRPTPRLLTHFPDTRTRISEKSEQFRFCDVTGGRNGGPRATVTNKRGYNYNGRKRLYGDRDPIHIICIGLT